MKPKTKLDKQVWRLHKQMPDLGIRKENWIKKNLFDHHVYNTKKQHECLYCNHTWEYTGKNYVKVKCPNCKMNLEPLEGRLRTHFQYHYVVDVTTFKGFQVVRYYHVRRYLKSKRKPIWYILPIIEHWIRNDGKYVTLSVSRNGTTKWTYLEGWNIYSDISVKHCYDYHYIANAIDIPYKRFIPELIRNGFYGNFLNLDIAYFIELLLGNSKAETLLKANQYELFRYIDTLSEEYWGSIKICIRNNYIVHDARTWIDHINVLMYFNKDLRSPKYVCPDNLNKEHKKYVDKRTKILARQKLKDDIENAKKHNKEYIKSKSKYFKLKITDGDICITPLKNVKDFIIEQLELNHCIYSGEYYKRNDSLILHALKNNTRLETIEVSLKSLEILQCRGKFNGNTEYHDKILELVNSNMDKIKKLTYEKSDI
jgi:hypothetical protein